MNTRVKKKRSPTARRPASIQQTLKATLLSSAVRRLMGQTPHHFPLSIIPPVNNRFHNRVVLNYKNPIRINTLKNLNKLKGLHDLNILKYNINTLKRNHWWINKS